MRKVIKSEYESQYEDWYEDPDYWKDLDEKLRAEYAEEKGIDLNETVIDEDDFNDWVTRGAAAYSSRKTIKSDRDLDEEEYRYDDDEIRILPPDADDEDYDYGDWESGRPQYSSRKSIKSSASGYDFNFFLSKLKDNPYFEEYYPIYNDDQGEYNIHLKKYCPLVITYPDGHTYEDNYAKIIFSQSGWRLSLYREVYDASYSMISNFIMIDDRISIDTADGENLDFNLSGRRVESSRRTVKSNMLGDVYDQGYEDALDGERPMLPNDPTYMEGYNNGRRGFNCHIDSAARPRNYELDEQKINDIFLTVVNNAETVNEGVIKWTIDNLKKHVRRGVYDKAKALISWQRVADEAVKLWDKEWGTGRGSLQLVNPAERKELAERLMDYYEENVMND